jgi:hypothetical protein
VSGEADDDEMFLGFTSFTFPLTPYRYSFKDGTLAEFEKVKGTVDSAAYEVEQVWAPSKDGTKISMFLVHKRGLPRDGQRPTLLTGYGGFNVDLTPSYSSSRFVWLERGGLLAIPNLRGGGEYGESWHQAGMLDRKQNVFDDFIACAEWLISSGYTSRERLAIQGGSNGGLLVGAVMVQRPDLAGAVICQVPVADMLRYHLFTVGRYWIPEYGSAENPAQVPVPVSLLAVPQREGRDALPGHPRHHRRHRRPRRPGPGQEVRGPAAGGHGQRQADPDPHRDQGRPRRRQARSPSRSTSRPTSTRSCSGSWGRRPRRRPRTSSCDPPWTSLLPSLWDEPGGQLEENDQAVRHESRRRGGDEA